MEEPRVTLERGGERRGGGEAVGRDLLEGGAERLLTEMNDDDLMRLVALDLRAASSEG